MGKNAAFLHLQRPVTARFLSGGEYKNSTAPPFRLSGQMKGRHGHGRYAAFHIAGAPSNKASIFDLRTVRRRIPWGITHGNRVQMPGENQRQF